MIWIPKVWGGEQIIARNDKYCGKVLHLNKHHFSSFHRHDKCETLMVASGTVLFLYSEEKCLEKGDKYDYIDIFVLKSLLKDVHQTYVRLSNIKYDKDLKDKLKIQLLEVNDKIDIDEKMWHLFYGIEDSRIFEVSTPDVESERITESQ